MGIAKKLIDFYEALEGPMGRLVERCNNAGDYLNNTEEVISAEAALERLYRARKEGVTLAPSPNARKTIADALSMGKDIANHEFSGLQREEILGIFDTAAKAFESLSTPAAADARPVVVPADADASEMNRQHGEDYGKDWVHPVSAPEPVATFRRIAEYAENLERAGENATAVRGLLLALNAEASEVPEPVALTEADSTLQNNGGRTGSPPGLLQDDSSALSKALARDPNARQLARDAALAASQPAPVGWKLVPTEPSAEEVADVIELEFSQTGEWPEGDSEVVRAFVRNWRPA